MWLGRTDPLQGEEFYNIVTKQSYSPAVRQLTRQEFDKVSTLTKRITKTKCMHKTRTLERYYPPLAPQPPPSSPSPRDDHFATEPSLALHTLARL